LTTDFARLDAHQKTILSDDFGMGIPMYWLKRRLNLREIVDGRYFIDFIAASEGATSTRTAKRGPNKSPDFVAKDKAGIWHVVECKGTQSGDDYRDAQLRGSSAVAGAVRQKMAIQFPSGYVGQRLACGVTLTNEEDTTRTSLKIIDPVMEEEPFALREEYLSVAEDASIRSSVAVSLRLAGFRVASDAIASPAGPRPTSRPGRGTREDDRQAFVNRRRELAVTEIDSREGQSEFRFQRRPFFGRELSLDLPRVVSGEDGTIRAVRVRQGVSAEALRILHQQRFPDRHAVDRNSLADLGPVFMEIEEDGESAELKVGQIYVATIELIRAR
jgi:hypothetical protein